jgi:hypothetical protein
MTNSLRVIVEIGPKRRIVAGATDWPGLDRWGTSEDDATARLTSYLPRYAGVADRAGLARALKRAGDAEVIERVAGSSSTDWWGIAHVPSEIEAEVLSAKDLDRRLDLLHACWDYFDDVAARVPKDLEKGARGGGRERDEIIRHVYGSERHLWWRKVGLRAEDGVSLKPKELAKYRRQYVDSIRVYNAEGRKARTWPIQFLVRRTAHHVMDHAWEMEDRALPSLDDAGRVRSRR